MSLCQSVFFAFSWSRKLCGSEFVKPILWFQYLDMVCCLCPLWSVYFSNVMNVPGWTLAQPVLCNFYIIYTYLRLLTGCCCCYSISLLLHEDMVTMYKRYVLYLSVFTLSVQCDVFCFISRSIRCTYSCSHYLVCNGLNQTIFTSVCMLYVTV
jgi:hypothetical protein